jgi:hypothetical protein
MHTRDESRTILNGAIDRAQRRERRGRVTGLRLVRREPG